MSGDTDTINDTIFSTEEYAELEFQTNLFKTNLFLLSVSLSVNVFHFYVLTRKELRSLSIFILMTAICICDLLYIFVGIYVYGNNVRTYLRIDYCFGYDSLLVTWLSRLIFPAGEGALFASVWLVVLMAFFRSISVTFPLNQAIKKVTDKRATIISMMIVMLFCYSWNYNLFLVIYRIQEYDSRRGCRLIEERTPDPVQFRIVYDAEQKGFLDWVGGIENWILNAELVLYTLFSALLIFSLRKTRKKKQMMVSRNQKDNTTKLVLTMTVVFLGSHVFSPILDLFYDDLMDQTNFLFNIVSVVRFILENVHSSSHCFISFFMSTQYRDTVKRVLGVGKKRVKVVSVTASLTTTKTSTTMN